MEARKQAFSKDVVNIIHQICKLAFNIDPGTGTKEVFGLNEKQMEKVIAHISDELPKSIFTLTPKALEEIKSIIAREFVFFQVQEKGDEAHYDKDLSNFIAIFNRDIQQKLKGPKK